MPFSSRPPLLLLILPFLALFWLETNKSSAPAHHHTANPKQQPIQPAALVNQASAPIAPVATEEGGAREYKQRVVAVADIHGDLPHLMRILRRAELVDLKGQWTGGETILVQTGDIVDRGPDTIAIYRYLQTLRPQAEKAGGGLLSLMGNHEVMNYLGDWRYVTKEDIASFGGERNRREAMSTGWIGQEWRGNYSFTARVPYLISSFPPSVPATSFPVTPLGSSDRRFVGDPSPPLPADEDPFAYSAASFVHGGITPEYLSSLDTDSPISKINSIGSSILYSLLNSPAAPLGLPRSATPEQREFWSERGPLWCRDWALEEEEEICGRVDKALEMLKVKRMIMGHTPQFEGILSRCGGKVLVIDTGISRAYGGPLSSLKITHTLTPPSLLPLADALAFNLIDLADPNPEETLRTMGQDGGKVRWVEREVVKALYADGKEQELAREERTVELPVK
ncbi:hypothetical protein JCM8097_007085 [Rhodosporidiobolus ruineniae]